MAGDRACPLGCWSGDCNRCDLANELGQRNNGRRFYLRGGGHHSWIANSGPLEAEGPLMWPFLRARWLPFAAFGAIALLVGAFGSGYMKGSHSAEVRLQKELNQALQEQAEHLRAAHGRQMAALEAKNQREHDARQIGYIPRPVGPLCDAGGEWLQSIQDGLRSANDLASPD